MLAKMQLSAGAGSRAGCRRGLGDCSENRWPHHFIHGLIPGRRLIDTDPGAHPRRVEQAGSPNLQRNFVQLRDRGHPPVELGDPLSPPYALPILASVNPDRTHFPGNVRLDGKPPTTTQGRFLASASSPPVTSSSYPGFEKAPVGGCPPGPDNAHDYLPPKLSFLW